MLSGIELEDYLVKAEIQSDDYDYDDMDINDDSRDKWIKHEIDFVPATTFIHRFYKIYQ